MARKDGVDNNCWRFKQKTQNVPPFYQVISDNPVNDLEGCFYAAVGSKNRGANGSLSGNNLNNHANCSKPCGELDFLVEQTVYSCVISN